jgi:exonuclease III
VKIATFNVNGIRSWKKDAWLQPASREAYRRLLAQGWIDALRVKHPAEPIFTFWDYFRNHRVGLDSEQTAMQSDGRAKCILGALAETRFRSSVGPALIFALYP